MKHKGLLKTLLCILLIFTVAVIPTVALAAESADTGDDYSKEGSYFNTVFNSADVLRALGYSVSDEEYAYLAEYGRINIMYEEVTSQHVTVETYEGKTRVIAAIYSYVAKNGSMLTWTPVSASIDGVEANLVREGDDYVADFGVISINDSSEVSVEYALDKVFNVSREDINADINLAYNNVDGLRTTITATKSEYEAKKAEYDEFCAQNPDVIARYESDVAAYKQYVIDKLAYDEKNAIYQNYIEAYERYELDKAAYEQYLIDLDAYNFAYDNNLNYDSNLIKYNKDLEKYNAYLRDRATVKEQLAAFDAVLFDSVTSLDRTLYPSIKAGLVDQVIEQKAIFTTLGADARVIDNCEAATGVLRRLLDEYKTKKTEKDKYDFYKQNYVQLRDNFILLTQALENLYTVGTIATVMMQTEKTDKFVIFVAQLILCSNILSDTPVYDFTGKKVLDLDTKISYFKHDSRPKVTESVLQILEGDEYAKSSAPGAPLANGYPQDMQEPAPPVIMDVPERPTDLPKPVAPEAEEHPGDAPSVVNEPTPPVNSNGNVMLEPHKPEILDNEIYAGIISAYDSGLITERAEVSEDFELSPTKVIKKKLKSADSVTVQFTDVYGDVIASVVVDKNTAAGFAGEAPRKPEDLNASYEFSYWGDVDGNAYDLSNIESDVTLYPYYTATYKTYETEYVAGLNYLVVDSTAAPLTRTDVDNLLAQASAAKAGLIIKASNVTVSLKNSDVNNMIAEGVTTVETLIDLSNPKAYKFCITFSKGYASAEGSYTVDVSIPCTDEEFVRASNVTYIEADGNEAFVNKSYKNGAISVKLRANTEYLMCVRHNVTLRHDFELGIDPTDKSVTASVDMAIPGDTVTLNVPDLPGILVEMYYYQNGEKQVISGNSFVMPDTAISIMVKYTRIVYTVTFMNGNEVISKNTYYYGDTIVVPANPSKASDGEYSYTFSGWSPELAEQATGDVVYQAQFDAEELPQLPPEPETKLVMVILTIIAAIIFLLTGTLVFFEVKRRKNNKSTPESACKDTDENTATATASSDDTPDTDGAIADSASDALNGDDTNEEPPVIYVDDFGGELLPNVGVEPQPQMDDSLTELDAPVADEPQPTPDSTQPQNNTTVEAAAALLDRFDATLADIESEEMSKNDTNTVAEEIDDAIYVDMPIGGERVENLHKDLHTPPALDREYDDIYGDITALGRANNDESDRKDS